MVRAFVFIDQKGKEVVISLNKKISREEATKIARTICAKLIQSGKIATDYMYKMEKKFGKPYTTFEINENHELIEKRKEKLTLEQILDEKQKAILKAVVTATK